jgi:hypothetical protein
LTKCRANLDLFYEIEIKNPNGEIISKVRERSRSLLRNFALGIRCAFSGSGVAQTLTVSTKDTSNTTRTFYGGYSGGYWSFMSAGASYGTDSFGIQVGTGNTSVTRDDYALASKCSHGTGTNQFQYGSTTVEDVDGTAPSSQFRIIRTFSNGSGSNINVNEIGLAIFNAYTQNPYYFLMARDVFGSPVTVPDGSTLTVRYIFSVTA